MKLEPSNQPKQICLSAVQKKKSRSSVLHFHSMQHEAGRKTKRSKGKEADKLRVQSKLVSSVGFKDASSLFVSGDEEPTRPLQNERQDGRAERRVVAELLQVAAVLPFGPNGHLDETHQGEEGHRQTLGHQGEAEPRAQLWEEEVQPSVLQQSFN